MNKAEEVADLIRFLRFHSGSTIEMSDGSVNYVNPITQRIISRCRRVLLTKKKKDISTLGVFLLHEYDYARVRVNDDKAVLIFPCCGRNVEIRFK